MRPAGGRITSYVDPHPQRSSVFWYPWGYSNQGAGVSFNFGYQCASAYSWWSWPYYLGWYTPYRYRNFYYPHCFGGGLYGPNYGSSVLYAYDNSPQVIYVESEPEVVYVDPPDAGAQDNYSGPLPVPAESDPGAEQPAFEGDDAGGDELTLASERYLTLGDRAFREGRYGDAVHFYARAVEFTADVGVLYLILSDALFATGDYHYAAYAIRRAIDLDPALVDSVVDKHGFYGEAVDFDQQLAVLETYVRDHPLDPDAVLVLGLNYLFGGRPAAAVDLLQSRAAETGDPRGPEALILAAAERIQSGAASDN